jgi:anti-sigma B factor antagonist
VIIRTESSLPGAVVHLVGRFDSHECEGFRRTVTPLLSIGANELRLDLSQVAFVDSTALAELVRLNKAARAINCEVILTELSDPVRVILEITQLAGQFAIEAASTDNELQRSSW